MAASLSLTQIAGPHLSTYEAYYRQADHSGQGAIAALDAALFLKKSGLPEAVLSQIWELSDPSAKGFLDKQGFFVALKLIALAQNGQEVSVSHLSLSLPPPSMGEIPGGMGSAAATQDGGWIITMAEKTKYDLIFDGLQPVNNLLPGDKVKPVLINSKLPLDVLGRVWELSDIDKDGFLDRDEFAVAMHLVYKALEKEPVPSVIPPQLMPPSKRRRGSVLAGAVPVLPSLPPPGMGSGRSSPSMAVPALGMAKRGSITPWIVTATEKAQFDTLFVKADTDMDGLVAGGEVKDIFFQSGLSQAVLAHIWTLCDIPGTGKLNSEQFALAMHLIQQKIQGLEPPQTLTPDMIPPSMKPAMDVASQDSGLPSQPASQELDAISKEIEDLKKEKMKLEQDKAQREADIKIRNVEVAALQKELDAINSTVKQLENQKGEAQKRLDDLDDKRSKLERTLQDLKEKCEDEQKQLDALKSQIDNQETLTKTQEEELGMMRSELNVLRQEESELEQMAETSRNQLDSVLQSMKSSQVQMDESKQKIQHLENTRNQINQSIRQYMALINGEAGAAEPTPSSADMFTRSTTMTLPAASPLSTLSGFSGPDDFKEDPFKSKDPFGSQSSSHDFFQDDLFKPAAKQDPFKEDLFKPSGIGADPFGGSDPFADAFSSQSSKKQTSDVDFFQSDDPFEGGGAKSGEIDMFEAAFSAPKTKSAVLVDPFDPFGGGGGNAIVSPFKEGVDPFGADPFAPSGTGNQQKKKSAPPPPRSPAPKLPPKQKKMPPPRPPAPKSKTPTPQEGGGLLDPFGGSDPFAGGGDLFSGSSPTGFDPFGGGGGKSSSNTGDAFANFADFGSSSKTTPLESPQMAWGTQETSQLAWATQESRRLESERQRQREQEEADLELAIQLSKAELHQSSDA